MKIKELVESKSYTRQDVNRVVERLPRGLTLDQIENITRNYLEKIYGTGTTGLILYQGIVNDIVPLYQKYVGPLIQTHKTKNKSKPKQPSAEQLAKKKTELIFQAEKIAKEMQSADQWLDKAAMYLEQWPITKFSTSQDVANNYEIKKSIKRWSEIKNQKQQEFDAIKQELDRLSINGN